MRFFATLSVEGCLVKIDVEAVLALPAYAGATVIAGKEGVDRLVNNVSFMEVPDILPYVSKGSLLLTTFYPIAGNEEAMRELVPRLAEKGLAGLAVKLGRYVTTLPDMMVEAADHHNFPLITLPEDANLSGLSNAVLEVLLEKQNSILKFRDEIHQQLMRLLLNGAHINTFVTVLSGMIQMPVFLFSGQGDLRAQSISDEPFERDGMAVKLGDRIFTGDEVIAQPIRVGEESLGELIALDVAGKRTTTIHVAMEQASILLALDFQRERAILEQERNYLDAFLRDILNGRFRSEEEVLRRAHSFNWNLSLPLGMIAVEQKVRMLPESETIERFERWLSGRFSDRELTHKVIYYEDSLICFVNEPDDTTLIELGTYVHEQAARERRDVIIACSSRIDRLRDLAGEYERLRQTLRIMRSINLEPVQTVDALGMYALLFELEDAPLRRLVERRLGRLLGEEELLRTLLTLIRCQMNVQKASQQLFIHYNTLRYRIERLKALGFDLTDGEKMSEYYVASQALHVLNSRIEDERLSEL
nr:PucR family transcriptional regulator [Exiguobacterium sp.]